MLYNSIHATLCMYFYIKFVNILQERLFTEIMSVISIFYFLGKLFKVEI